MTQRVDIVIIDDEPVFRRALSATLENHGFHVESFADPLEGLKFISATLPRLLILDWFMPGMDGKEVLVQLSKQENWGEMQVFMVTSADLAKRGKELFGTLGATRTYIKPVHFREFAAEVEAFLALERS